MNIISRGLIWALPSVILLFVACGNDDGGPVGSGSCGLEPTFTSIYTSRLNTGSCASGGCHNAVSNAGGLNFQQAQADVLADFVDVASLSIPSKIRVVPGNASESYFHEKVRSNDPGGALGRMPPTGSPLSACEIDAIGDWINAGALND